MEVKAVLRISHSNLKQLVQIKFSLLSHPNLNIILKKVVSNYQVLKMMFQKLSFLFIYLDR